MGLNSLNIIIRSPHATSFPRIVTPLTKYASVLCPLRGHPVPVLESGRGR